MSNHHSNKFKNHTIFIKKTLKVNLIKLNSMILTIIRLYSTRDLSANSNLGIIKKILENNHNSSN